MKPEPKEYPIRGQWRKKYKCHKNKGDHTFEVVYAKRYYGQMRQLFRDIAIYHECTACGKHRIEWVDDV